MKYCELPLLTNRVYLADIHTWILCWNGKKTEPIYSQLPTHRATHIFLMSLDTLSLDLALLARINNFQNTHSPPSHTQWNRTDAWRREKYSSKYEKLHSLYEKFLSNSSRVFFTKTTKRLEPLTIMSKYSIYEGMWGHTKPPQIKFLHIFWSYTRQK